MKQDNSTHSIYFANSKVTNIAHSLHRNDITFTRAHISEAFFKVLTVDSQLKAHCSSQRLRLAMPKSTESYIVDYVGAK